MGRIALAVFSVLLLGACSDREKTDTSTWKLPQANGYWINVTGELLPKIVTQTNAQQVVVHVWSTWCDPCVRELPGFLRTMRTHSPKDVALVLVCADFETNRAEAERFLRAQGVSAPSFFKTGSDQTFIDAVSPQWSGALPATALFDRSGKRLGFWGSPLSENELSAILKRFARK